MSSNFPWFKVYNEIIYDPKINRLTPSQRWFWITLLSLASSSEESGVIGINSSLPYEIEELSQLSGCTVTEVRDALEKMHTLQMIEYQDGLILIINFEKRQEKNLTQAERARNYRKRLKNNKLESYVTSVTGKSDVRNQNVTIDKNRIDKKRKEYTHTCEIEFEKFWKAYPKRKSRGRAEKAWNKISPDEQLQSKILASIERAKTSENWVKESGRFIPHPATWLNDRGWEDEEEVDNAINKQASARASPVFQRRTQGVREFLAKRKSEFELKQNGNIGANCERSGSVTDSIPKTGNFNGTHGNDGSSSVRSPTGEIYQGGEEVLPFA